MCSEGASGVRWHAVVAETACHHCGHLVHAICHVMSCHAMPQAGPVSDLRGPGLGAQAPVRELVSHVYSLLTRAHLNDGRDGSGIWPLVHAVAVHVWPAPVAVQFQVALSARILGGRAGHTARQTAAAGGSTWCMAVRQRLTSDSWHTGSKESIGLSDSLSVGYQTVA
jgi:hypothetical protein